jgi:ABC-type nitrate/sulfonate/bicarbonate transport system substrate-binding protein
MMAFSEIKNVPDLKRKTGGVTRVGSSTDFALRYLVQKNGIKFLPGCPWQKDTPSRS